MANRTRSTCVSACVRLLQLRPDVLVVLAVDVDLVAILLLNGKQLPLGVTSKLPLRATCLALASGGFQRRSSSRELRLLTFTRSGLELFLLSGDAQHFVGLVIGCPVVPHDEVRVLACSWLCSFSHPLWHRSFHPVWVRSSHPLWVRSFGFLYPIFHR